MSLVRTIEGHSRWIKEVEFSPDGTRIASCGDEPAVYVWNAITGDLVDLLRGLTQYIRTLSFSPRGKFLATGGDDGYVHLWDLDSGTRVQTIWTGPSRIHSVRFSPDGELVAMHCYGKPIAIAQVTSGQIIRKIGGERNSYPAFCFRPDGTILTSSKAPGGTEFHLRVANPTTGRWVRALGMQHHSIASLSSSPDGTIFATGCSDKMVRLCKFSTGLCYRRLIGHLEGVGIVRFSPNGKLLASCSISYGRDQTIRLWDLASGECRCKIDGYSSIQSLSFSPDSRHMVFATGSSLCIWRVPLDRQRMRVLAWARALRPTSQRWRA